MKIIFNVFLNKNYLKIVPFTMIVNKNIHNLPTVLVTLSVIFIAW